MASWSLSDVPLEGDHAPTATPDPKPPRRVRASQADWAGIHEHFADACCVHCGLPHESLHHILPRSQGGDDLVINLAPLCGDGTRGCHGILENHETGWERVAASVRQFVMTDNRRRNYQEDHASESFNRRYPPLPNTDPRFLEDFRRISRASFGSIVGDEFEPPGDSALHPSQRP